MTPRCACVVHHRGSGLKPHAWLYVHGIVPVVLDRLQARRWPARATRTWTTHPAFDQPDRRLTAADEIRRRCS